MTGKTEKVRSRFASLRQSAQPEISLRRSGRQKNALFQKGLAERPETALPARRPFSFSFRPVSPQGRDLANLVTASGIVSIQWLDGWHGPVEFESASGLRMELGSKSTRLLMQRNPIAAARWNGPSAEHVACRLSAACGNLCDQGEQRSR